MRIALCLVATIICLGALAQPATAQSDGLPPEWDARQMLAALINHTGEFAPLLKQIKPQEWTAKGASGAYADQLASLSNEISYLERAASELAERPDRLTKALETYFRLESVDAILTSVIDGVRRYQNPAMADLLQEMRDNQSAYNLEIRNYLAELAAAKEAECRIADEEAQRCRAEIIGAPAAKVQPRR